MKRVFEKYNMVIAFLFIILEVKLLHTFAFRMNLVQISSLFAVLFTSLVTLNSYYFINKGINDYKKVFNSKKTFILYILMIMLISLFVGGNQLFISDMNLTISFGAIRSYIGLCIFIFPIVYNFILFLSKVKINDKKSVKKITANDLRKFFIIAFLINFIITLVVSIGFFPGNMTSDSIDIVSQAFGLRPIGGGHPPFNAILLKGVYTIAPHPFAGIVSCELFLSIVLAYVFTYFRKDGVNKYILYALVFIFTIMGNNLILMTILWKDIPFTIALLWLSFEMYKITKEKFKYFDSKLNITRLVISLIFVYMTRYNGMFPYFVCILYLIYLAYKAIKKKPLIITIIISILSIFIIKYPVFALMNVHSDSMSSGAGSFALKGVISLVYYDVDLSNEDEEIINKLGTKEELKEVYSKYNIDTISFGPYANKINGGMEEVGVLKLYGLYIKHFFIHPDVIIKDRLDSNNLLWSYVTPDDGFNMTYAIGVWYPASYDNSGHLFPETNKDGGYTPEENIISKYTMKYMGLINKTPLYYIIWRAAFPLTLLIILMYFMFKNNIKLWPMLFPTLISILFWVMLLSHQSYRYLWFIQVNTYMYYIAVLNNKKN